MRMEKISDNQIRCYLSKEEMESRNLHLKELAYGTEKARALFHELMREARKRYGFEAESTPVMIEAVPLQDESLVLIVTRVDNPEELDTRFSSFSPAVRSGSSGAAPASSPLGQLLDAIRQEIDGADGKAGPGKAGQAGTGGPGSRISGKDRNLPSGTQLYTFPTLGKAASAAGAVSGFSGKSSLYRDPADSLYYLFLTPGDGDPATDDRRVLSSLSEFGTAEYITPAREQHLREHCVVICDRDALQKLAELSEK